MNDTISRLLEAYEKGLCVWNEAISNFERLKVVWRKGDRENKDNGEKESRTNVPEGHPLFWKDATGKDGLLFGNPFPTFRCPPTFESWQDQKTWEAIAPPQALKSAADGAAVKPHSGSITSPGYNHLDVITAARKQNDGRPEPTSQALARFAGAVTGGYNDIMGVAPSGWRASVSPGIRGG